MARLRAIAEPARDRRSRRYLNRELSRLDFNERVLAMAEDSTLPRPARVPFLSIFSKSLDALFQSRVAALAEPGQAAGRPPGPAPALTHTTLREGPHR